ncbi:hypothetical protein Mkiyose1665_34290 [Mycobacterium kiyosense]|uniref:class I SAM-dependent methyltransferase n=1 Tax=Mycobacterium TaxID=1763 RepID=UPI000A14BD75|nr:MULTISPECIES: methyltransferase domain-containing protein [Mycobacterium]MCV7007298.1 methyltransferase domain-containing protein [Mycobacterium gordonae]PJE24224.1 MAG: SAM-dependent methyltransferase [Mycobacterium sp.]GLD42929.1 hypothetical protein Mkiyose1665_34290 [Mycobacterium kiyosense]
MSDHVAQDPKAFREFELAGWQRAVDRYHDAWGGLTQQAAGALLDAVGVTRNARLLDLATGPGYVASMAYERNADVVGIDFSAQMIQKARNLYPDIRFEEGDAESLSFADETFDRVTMNFGILHLGNPQACINESFRVLRRDGRLGFTVWASPEEALIFSVILQSVAEYGRTAVIPHGPDFFHYSSSSECRKALTAAGFTGIEVMPIDLTWHLPDADDIFDAFLYGTARTGGLLRAQDDTARTAIATQVRDAVVAFRANNGHVAIPMPAILAIGNKS